MGSLLKREGGYMDRVAFESWKYNLRPHRNHGSASVIFFGEWGKGKGEGGKGAQWRNAPTAHTLRYACA